MNPATNINNDDELILRCIRQDRVAQQELYEKYKRALYTRAFRMINNKEYAHDVLQESFIEIFHDLKNYRGDSGLFSWMKTIVYRKSLLHIKVENRFKEYESERYDDEIAWRDDLTAEYLDKAIKNLPDGYRAVFILAEVDGYRHKEIAELMGIAEGTSKSQLYQAKKQLQKILHELKP